MRLLLDEHYSARWIGAPLQSDGHEVRVATERKLRSKSDDVVLQAAVSESRILITADTGDFSELLRTYGEDGRSHTGVILVPKSIPNNDYGTLLRGIRTALLNTNHEMWKNRAIWLTRPSN